MLLGSSYYSKSFSKYYSRALSAAESEISTFRKKHTMHEKNSERAKKETRRLQDDLKKERDVLESIRKSTEIERKACKKISDEVKTTEGKIQQAPMSSFNFPSSGAAKS